MVTTCVPNNAFCGQVNDGSPCCQVPTRQFYLSSARPLNMIRWIPLQERRIIAGRGRNVIRDLSCRRDQARVVTGSVTAGVWRRLGLARNSVAARVRGVTLPQGGDNARGARVVLPWALLGPSRCDFDPFVVLTSRRDNGNVVAGARWGMKGRRQRSRCSRCLAQGFVRSVALRLQSIGRFLRPEGTTVTEPRVAALRRAPWECGWCMRHRSSRRRRVQPACSETEIRGVPNRGVA